MNFLKLTFFFLFLSSPLFAQKTAVNKYLTTDKKALQIPDSLTRTTVGIAKYIKTNFKSEDEKTRAAFIWVASSIKYDVENMFALNFYESDEERIANALKNRKGICGNYASLFSDICSKAGLKAYVVSGYTQIDQYTDFTPHAWTAVRIDSSWFLFDPTWAAGYVSKNTFFPKINNDYYKVVPATFVKSHMPYDYLWQFVPHTITNQEFYEGKTHQNKAKPYFNFTDSLKAFEKRNKTGKLIAAAYRIEKNGVKNPFIFNQLAYIRTEVETEVINLYNAALTEYNAYISFYNKQFNPQKTDAEIQKMLDSPAAKIEEAKVIIALLEKKYPDYASNNSNNKKLITDFSNAITEHKAWLTKYFSKNKLGRKSMFYNKITWFGIPLN